MKVALFQPYYHSVGGSEKNVLKVMQALRAHGMDAAVICPGEGRFTELAREQGIMVITMRPPKILDLFHGKYYELGVKSVLKYLIGFFYYNFRLARYLRFLRADVVLLNTARAPLIAGLAPVLAGIPSVLHLRGYVPSPSRFEKIVRWWLTNSVTEIISVSRESFTTLVDGMSTRLKSKAYRKLRVVYNWLPDELLSFEPQGIRDRKPARIVSIANIVPRKGIHHLIDLAVMLRQQMPSFEIIVAGEVYDEQYYEDLLRRVRDENLVDIVKFVGFLPPEAVLREADVLVLASDREGMPMALLESMGMGVPVVAFAAEGVREALGDANAGFVIPKGNVSEMASAICRLINDADLRNRMSREGRARASFFSRERQSAELSYMIRKVVSRRVGQ
ncbi:MAG: glycosyltransferase family 4 protein [Alicyclobacillus sp.]|nr:glycosyltransferase family 4 protein [Alicyclobacillus sp.]